MRRLTFPEIEKEVRDIETRPWPYENMLPLKNLYDGRLGAIFREVGTIRPIVAHKAGGPIDYPSLTAMVLDGWVVD